jgi:sugar lactone lactonase YvrE
MPTSPLLPAGLIAALAAAPAAAQTLLPLTPYPHTGDLYVTDSTNDAIFRLVDLDLDGDYDGPGEVNVYYDDTTGSIALTNNNGIAVGGNGTIYVTDSNERIVLALDDLDGNGDCFGPGEARIYFDGTGGAASGVFMGSAANVCVDLVGNLWVAVSGAGSTAPFNVDKVLRLSDFNADGDANDAFEAHEYYFPAQGGGTGDTLPQDVQVGPDGVLYMADIPSSGSLPKAIYRLFDGNLDGVIEDSLGEATTYFVPPTLGSSVFFWGLAIDRDGYFYLADTTGETVHRFRDVDGNGTIDPLTESVAWWTAAGDTNIWRLAAASDGSLLAAETQTPDRILRLVDLDQNGVVDPLTETFVLWSDTLGGPDIGNPRSLALARQPTVDVDVAPSIGTVTQINTFANTADAALVYYSAATLPPFPLPPFGFLQLDPTAGFGLLLSGTVPPFGPLQTFLPIPNDPVLVGAALHLQGIAGKLSRLQLTNLATMVFQP